MKKITREDARTLIAEIGHMATVSILINNPEYRDHGHGPEKKKVTILNEAICYDKDGAQLGGASNEANADTTVDQIDREFEVYSDYFRWASGGYEII
jgi:hypothetical protein